MNIMSRVNVYWLTALGCGLIIVLVLILIPIVTMSNNSDHVEYKKLKIGQTELTVEIADSANKIVLGLSGRDSLPVNTGMLFIYREPFNGIFYMRGMKFALDFLWIAQNRVVQIDENIPPPASAQAEPVKVYPKQSYNMVLEVPAGWVRDNNINLGDKLELE